MISSKSEEPQYYLGIDWGSSRVGLAIADDVMRISTGLEEISAGEALEKIKQLEAQYGFEKIILGVPTHDNFRLKKELENFLRDLKKFGKEIVTENEFFSTKVAQTNLSSGNKRNISHNDNIEAARLILQGFLDKSPKK
jgi:RNase H-fold protein (predicted Holliday junction resolvase)